MEVQLALLQFTSPTILGVVAAPSERSVKRGALWLAACTSRSSPATTPSCRRFSSSAANSPSRRRPAARRSPRGCRSRSARTSRREPAFRREQAFRRASTRRESEPASARSRPPGHRSRTGGAAQRPRRMGLCSEVADGGKIRMDHPALGKQIRPPQARRFSVWISRATQRPRPLNLFRSLQTKPLPGTLHHSGNRPAPPSDHTPLARRSAFWGAHRRTRYLSKGIPLRAWG